MSNIMHTNKTTYTNSFFVQVGMYRAFHQDSSIFGFALSASMIYVGFSMDSSLDAISKGIMLLLGLFLIPLFFFGLPILKSLLKGHSQKGVEATIEITTKNIHYHDSNNVDATYSYNDIKRLYHNKKITVISFKEKKKLLAFQNDGFVYHDFHEAYAYLKKKTNALLHD